MITIYVDTYVAQAGEVRLDLNRRQYLLLMALRTGEVISSVKLAELLNVGPRSVPPMVSRLFNLFGPAANFIQAVHGVGYKLKQPANIVTGSPLIES